MSPAAPPSGGPGAETYLRLRAEAELRRAQALSPRGTPDDGDEAQPGELTPGEGLRRFSVVAHALVLVGAIGRDAADAATEDLAATLFARSWIGPGEPGMADLLRPLPGGRPTRAPAGQYRAVPVGVTVPCGSGSGLEEARLFALAIAPDRVLLTAAGRLRKPLRRRRSRYFEPPLRGAAPPEATDDRGNSYHVHEDTSTSDSDGNWTCLLSLSPVPQPQTQWLELTMSPESPPVRVNPAGHATDSDPPASLAAAGSPAERIVDAAAQRLLHAAVIDPDEEVPSWYDLSEIADIVTALEAVGALGAARRSVGSLVTLADRVGVRIPAALSEAEPAGLPAAWQNILENHGRADGPFGVAPAVAVLPELDGTRFVLAGLCSGAAGAELQTLAWGLPPTPRFDFFTDATRQWPWTARDDSGRWHVATEGGGSSSDRHAAFDLRLVPALHPEARSLEVTVAGPSGQVSATVPLDWWERA